MAYSKGVYTLLSAANATGQPVEWPGGKGVFSVPTGTFGGATVALEYQIDGTTWQAADRSGDTYTTFTAAGSGLFELPACLIRASVTGGSPSGLNALVATVKA